MTSKTRENNYYMFHSIDSQIVIKNQMEIYNRNEEQLFFFVYFHAKFEFSVSLR